MTHYIELNNFLKINGLVATGGQAKNLIRSGVVFLNGTVETQNKKKLISGDVVSINGKKLTVSEDVCLKHKD